MPTDLLSKRTDKILVSQHYRMCATRERGQRFYQTLHDLVMAGDAADCIVISFVNVDFVSPSFLDETVVRLLEEHPELEDRIRVSDLHPMAASRLKAALSERGIDGAEVVV